MTHMQEETRRLKEKALWDKLAPGYDANVMKIYRTAYAESIRLAAAGARSDERILEIGCGTGIISLALAAQFERVDGVDISEKMIAVARKKAVEAGIANAAFQACDGYALPFEDGSFDRVLLFNILHIVSEPRRLLCEAHRLLKPGGRLVTATDCAGEAKSLKERFNMTFERILHLLGIIPFIAFYRRSDLRRLLEENGFSVLEAADLHPAPVNHYLLARRSEDAYTARRASYDR